MDWLIMIVWDIQKKCGRGQGEQKCKLFSGTKDNAWYKRDKGYIAWKYKKCARTLQGIETGWGMKEELGARGGGEWCLQL